MSDEVYFLTRSPSSYIILPLNLAKHFKNANAFLVYYCMCGMIEHDFFNYHDIINDFCIKFNLSNNEMKRIFQYLQKVNLIKFKEIKENDPFKVGDIRIFNGDNFDKNVEF